MLNALRILIDLGVGTTVGLLFFIGVVLEFRSNSARHSLKFRLQRTANWVIIGFCRALQVQARYCFASLATPSGVQPASLDLVGLAWIISIGLWTTPFGTLAFGFLVDWFGEKQNMTVAMFIQTTTTIGMGFIIQFAPHGVGVAVVAGIYYVISCFLIASSEVVLSKSNAAWFGHKDMSMIAGIFTLCDSFGFFLGFSGNSITLQITETPSAIFFVNGSMMLIALILVIVVFKTYANAALDEPASHHAYSNVSEQEDKEGYEAFDGGNKDSPVENSKIEINNQQQLDSPQETEPQVQPKELTRSDAMLNWRFFSFVVCFFLAGYLRDAFFFMLNTYLQEKFFTKNESSAQIIAYAALTIGSCLSAYIAVLLAGYFKERTSLNGTMCSILLTLSVLIFAASPWLPLTVIAIFFYAISVMCIQGIRRITSAVLGGYKQCWCGHRYEFLFLHYADTIGFLGFTTFVGGGGGSLLSQYINMTFGNAAYALSLSCVAMLSIVLFVLSRYFEKKRD